MSRQLEIASPVDTVLLAQTAFMYIIPVYYQVASGGTSLKHHIHGECESIVIV